MLHIVYPYLAKGAKSDELLYSIRSIDQHLKEIQYQIIIVGDKPGWMNDQVIHLNCPQVSKSPLDDIVNKLRNVITSTEVNSDFVWMNDDIYLINDIMVKDLVRPRAIEDLDQVQAIGKRNVDRAYYRNMWNAYDALKKEGMRVLNTATHLPFWYNKEQMAYVLDRYEVTTTRMLISILYFNTYYKHTIEMISNSDGAKCGIYSGVRSVQEIEARSKHSLFLNHSNTGWKESEIATGRNIIEMYLRKKFPNPSKYEL